MDTDFNQMVTTLQQTTGLSTDTATRIVEIGLKGGWQAIADTVAAAAQRHEPWALEALRHDPPSIAASLAR